MKVNRIIAVPVAWLVALAAAGCGFQIHMVILIDLRARRYAYPMTVLPVEEE